MKASNRAYRPEMVRSTHWSLHCDSKTTASFHSAPKESIEPPGANDPQTDFFALYRRESEDFDGDYARKYDEDLDTPLILVSGSTFSFDTEG